MGTISDKLLDKHRDINVEYGHEWWDRIFDDCVDDMKELGIDISPNVIQFSGFWSQGDGASFTGDIDSRKFLSKHPELRAECPACAYFVDLECVTLTLVRRGRHYCHSNTVSLDTSLDYYADDSDQSDDLRNAVGCAMYQLWCGGQGQAFENEIESICRGHMDKLYRNLEEEYTYLTSDEAVREALEENGIFDDEEAEEEEHA